MAHEINEMKSSKLRAFKKLDSETQSSVVLFLSKESQKDILPNLKTKEIFNFLVNNDEDDAAEILRSIEHRRARQILQNFSKKKSEKIKKIMNFDPNTAEGLMDLNYILVKDNFLVSDVAKKIEKHISLEKKVPLVLVSGHDGKVKGYIPYRNLILNYRYRSIAKLVRHLPLISHDINHEKTLKEALKNHSEAIGVVDEDEKILGIIHLQDLIKIIQRQSSKDLYKFAGVSHEEEMNDSVFTKIKRRYKWLIVNLFTALLAGAVVAIFDSTITKVATLAIFMPIIAGEGGNAGTQALAVVVRGMANGDISKKIARNVIMKETLAGTVNGIIVGTITAISALAYHLSPLFGLVVGIAMVANLFVAGFFGALIPFILKRFNIDPATASSVFVTTATDVFGFFTLLGLGTLLLL